MAGTLADSVIGIAQDTNKQVAGAGADALNAYHIASTAEHARQELEMEKTTQAMNKAAWFHSQLDQASRMEDGKVKDMTFDSIKKQAQQIYPDMNIDNLDVLRHKPELTTELAGIMAKYANGQDLSPQDLKQMPSILGTHTADFNSMLEKARQEKMQMMGNQLKADSMNGRAAAALGQLDEKKNQDAVAAGKDFEHDKILSLSKTAMNSLAKSTSILNNKTKSLSAYDLNLAYNDYINSVAQGGAATEGKIARELPETFEKEFAAWKQKYGMDADMRKSPQGQKLISDLQNNIGVVKQDMKGQIADQALNLHDTYKSNTNPRVQQTVKDKLKAYAPEKYGELYGGKAVAPPPSDDRINVISPDGKVGHIPKSQLEDALKQGFKVKQ